MEMITLQSSKYNKNYCNGQSTVDDYKQLEKKRRELDPALNLGEKKIFSNAGLRQVQEPFCMHLPKGERRAEREGEVT